MKVGRGGQLLIDEEGIKKQGIKLRLAHASKAAGVTPKHLPPEDNEVVFVVAAARLRGDSSDSPT